MRGEKILEKKPRDLYEDERQGWLGQINRSQAQGSLIAESAWALSSMEIEEKRGSLIYFL